MRVLIYTPTNSRAVDLQSVAELIATRGNETYLMSQTSCGVLQKNVEKYGVKTFSARTEVRSGVLFYLREFFRLAAFIRKHKIEIVFAHLQGAGLVAGLVARILPVRLYYVRHNTDEHILGSSRNAAIFNYLTNLVTFTIIAPSDKVFRYLTNEEKIRPHRILRINYGYNFSQYMETDRNGNASEIREGLTCQMLIVSVARLINVKRHAIMFEAVRRLIESGCDVKFICLGDGPLLEPLREQIVRSGLNSFIWMLGARSNVFDYLEAADVFLHLSQTEASNSSVKEAGFCKKPVVVCRDVGDFDDYILDGVNSFLVPKEEPVEATVEALKELYEDEVRRKKMGQALHDTIMQQFDITRVAPAYDKLLERHKSSQT